MCCPEQIIYKKLVEVSVLSSSTEEADICNNWKKEKLLSFEKKVLESSLENYNFKKGNYTQTINSIINQGIYTKAVISKLLRNGMSKEKMIKTMKYGLKSLLCDELNYYRLFNVTPENIMCEKQLLNDINKELIEHLTSIGWDDLSSVNFILDGLVNQSDCCLLQLSMNGIASTRILCWQGKLVQPSKRIIEFLRQLDLNNNIVQIIMDKGISEEARQILNDLGYFEIDEDINCICENDFVYRYPSCSEAISGYSHSSSNKSSDITLKLTCSCNADEKLSNDEKNKILEAKDYLRKEVMVPLSWALSKTLKYNPTNPVHYTACQLLRWKYNNVNPVEMNEALNFIIDATIKRDEDLVAEKLNKKEELNK